MSENHDHDADEAWFVQLESGVRLMTLDDLDAAFQTGTVSEDTLVRRDGTTKWLKLSEEIGGGITETAPPSPSAQSSGSTYPVVSEVAVPHVALADLDLEASLRSARRRRVFIGGVLGAAVVIGLAAVTAVNVARMRPHAALAAEVPVPLRVQATAEAEPEQVKVVDPKEREKNAQRRRNRAQGGANAAPVEDKPAATVFHSGGDAYDPLNAKL